MGGVIVVCCLGQLRLENLVQNGWIVKGGHVLEQIGTYAASCGLIVVQSHKNGAAVCAFHVVGLQARLNHVFAKAAPALGYALQMRRQNLQSQTFIVAHCESRSMGQAHGSCLQSVQNRGGQV